MALIEERRTSTGELRYRVRVRRKGRKDLSKTFARKSDARAWGRRMESELESGQVGSFEARKHTVAELLDRYQRMVLNQHESKAEYKQAHMEFWRDQIGHLLLSDLTPAVVVELRDKLITQKTPQGSIRTKSTANRYLATMSHAISVAVREWGWMTHNPVAKVKRFKEPQGRVRYLEEDERSKLLEECEKSRNKALLVAVVCCMATGLRKNELLTLRWEDVDLNRGWIVLHKTKNNRRRGVPVQGRALELLKEHSKVRRIDSDLVFPGSDPNKPVDIRSAFDRAVKRASIEDFTFHDLRHCAASYLAMNGASLLDIAEILGHQSIQMSKRYAHLTESHTSDLVKNMTSKVSGL